LNEVFSSISKHLFNFNAKSFSGNNMNQKSVLITGGSGLIGKRLTSLLLEKGYSVRHLSWSGKRIPGVISFKWDPEKGTIENGALDGAEVVIHLAGANIGEKRWTKTRRMEIVDSRVRSAEFLYEKIIENKIDLKAFITASAVGYYGSATSDFIFKEYVSPGNDFLGFTCRMWEETADLFSGMGTRTVKIRTGVVLDKKDSALAKIMIPARIGFLVRTGSGKQYMPWIHIDDLCKIYLKAIEDNSMNGAYNAVAPQHITHNEFIKTLGRVTDKFVIPVNIPSFILKLALGEMANVVLKGSRVSGEKIINEGYEFIFPELEGAIQEIFPTLFSR
jgi:uncharacterized protein